MKLEPKVTYVRHQAVLEAAGYLEYLVAQELHRRYPQLHGSQLTALTQQTLPKPSFELMQGRIVAMHPSPVKAASKLGKGREVGKLWACPPQSDTLAYTVSVRKNVREAEQGPVIWELAQFATIGE